MKKVVSLVLAGLILASTVLFFPLTADARDVNECYNNHEACRARALEMNASWAKVALTLTVCDIALGKCILMAEP
jgi:hypothetical protein